MGESPDKLTLDRIDSNEDYKPENCRWISRAEQTKNTRRKSFITIQGRTQRLGEWAKEIGVTPQGLCRRLDAGWSDTDLLSKPSMQRRKHNDTRN